MTAIILAGGRASRMRGRDKALVKIDGIPIIKRQIKILADIFKTVIVVTDNTRRYRLKGVKIIRDIIPEKGPLGGIYSGLLASDSFYNFVIACDMPFINERLVKYMIKNIKNFDIFLPKIGNKFHPLCGIYSKNCISVIRQGLTQDRLKVSDIFSKSKVKFISKKKLQSFDKKLFCLENINTPEDIKKYK